VKQISFKQLRYFQTVVQAGSFTAAAEILNVSQPALGMQIRALETELGAELLLRGARGVQTTPAGAVFSQHATRVMEALDDARRSVTESVQPAEEITLGVTPTLGRALFDDLMQGAAAAGTPFKIVLLEALTEELLLRLQQERLQSAFCYDAASNRSWIALPLFEEQLYLLGHPDVVPRKDVPLRDLPNYPLALGTPASSSRQAIEKAAARAHVKLDVRAEIAPISLKREMLIRKGLCTIVPYGLFLPEIENGTLGAARIRPGIQRRMSLLVRRSVPPPLREQLVAIANTAVAAQLRLGTLGWKKVRI
jgi:LysR family nitrogen assimilation transcriptional regulator